MLLLVTSDDVIGDERLDHLLCTGLAEARRADELALDGLDIARSRLGPMVIHMTQEDEHVERPMPAEFGNKQICNRPWQAEGANASIRDVDNSHSFLLEVEKS